MMNDKEQLITMLQEEFKRWKELLEGLSEEQITTWQLAPNWTIKDVIAHLMTWQQRSIARMEAALFNQEPDYSGWPAGLDPESEKDVDKINAWIYQTHKDQPWPSVYRDWRAGYLRFIELSQAVPEKDLFAPDKYHWLDGYPLAAVLQGVYEHHLLEHREPLQDWLRQH